MGTIPAFATVSCPTLQHFYTRFCKFAQTRSSELLVVFENVPQIGTPFLVARMSSSLGCADALLREWLFSTVGKGVR